MAVSQGYTVYDHCVYILVLNCRSIVWLTGSSSLLVVATPLPEQGGAVQEHRDMLYQLDITWAQDTQQPSVVISGAGA